MVQGVLSRCVNAEGSMLDIGSLGETVNHARFRDLAPAIGSLGESFNHARFRNLGPDIGLLGESVNHARFSEFGTFVCCQDV